MTIQRMRVACSILKTADTHSEYVVLIVFPQQQWLHEAPQCYIIRILSVLLLNINLRMSLRCHL